MNNTKTFKKNNFAPLFVALFIFFRAIIMSDRNRVGFADFYPLKLEISGIGIALVGLYLVFAFLSALLFAKLEKKFGKSGLIIATFLVTEPFIFVKQENCLNLFIWCLAILFILNALREKPIIPDEITLVVFLFVSTILFENALFIYVFPALVFYFSANIDKLFKSAKNLVMMCISAVSICAGVVLNDHLLKTNPAFDSFVKKYSFFELSYFGNIEYENALLFAFAIPVLVFGIYFYKEMFRNKSYVSVRVKNNKKSPETVESFNPVLAVMVVAIAYIFSVAGFAQAGSEALCTINYIIPLSMISLLNAGNSSAEKSMEKLSEKSEKHSLVFVLILIALFYVASRVFFAETDNLARYIINMN